MNKTEMLEEIFNHLNSPSLEAIVFDDGVLDYRQIGSMSESEDNIVTKINLTPEYWQETLLDWGITDVDNAPEDVKDDFIAENLAEHLADMPD